MVTFPPYAPSLGWYVCWLQNILDGKSEQDAIAQANSGISPKKFVRTDISDKNGNIISLSMAIEGGGRKTRNINNIENSLLSEHGNWRKNHLGALEAVYGRTPFFEHIIPSLSVPYQNRSLLSLKEFNSAIHQVLSRFLLREIPLTRLISYAGSPVVSERAKELASKINPEISVIDSFMKFGPETLFAIYV